MGNLETACDNLEKAREFFDKAIAIRVNGGDANASLLANSYLCLSTVFYRRREFETAFSMVGQSEALFFRTSAGAETLFNAQYVLIDCTCIADADTLISVHYAYGNIEFAQRRWAAAKRAYEASLQTGLAQAPIHPITAAAYYSLGCVEFEQKHPDNAK